MNRIIAGIALVSVPFAVGCSSRAAPQAAAPSTEVSISRAQVETAQRAWCDGLLSIAKESASGGDATAKARSVLKAAYGYADGAVLFKPTLTHGEQTFRLDERGALAYFVGGDTAYPNDTGFARKPWVKCSSQVRGVVQDGDMAIAMGNVYLTDDSGKVTMVDKTFGYRRSADGTLKIVLHHSSLPYQPKP